MVQLTTPYPRRSPSYGPGTCWGHLRPARPHVLLAGIGKVAFPVNDSISQRGAVAVVASDDRRLAGVPPFPPWGGVAFTVDTHLVVAVGANVHAKIMHILYI